MGKGATGALAVLLAAGVAPARADTQQTQNEWTTWSNTVHVAGRWGLSTDLTWRSTDDWAGLRSTELRSGLTWQASPQLTLAGGFSVIRNNDPGPDTSEERLWLQFATPQVLGRARLTHRVRIEERFIERIGKPDVEATRVRYLLKAQIPFEVGAGQPFLRGNYGVLQQELLLHVAGESQLNGHVFDQQRLAAGFGRRFNAAADFELVYLHQFASGRTVDTRGHVVLATLTTRF